MKSNKNNYQKRIKVGKTEIIIQSIKGTRETNQDAGFAFSLKAEATKDNLLVAAFYQAIKALSHALDQETFSNDAGATLTASLCYRLNNNKSPLRILTAQIGDSGAYLISPRKITRITPVHQPHIKSEAERIYQSGGSIWQGYVLPHRWSPVGLAMTRCLGNKFFRSAGVTVEPDMISKRISSRSEVLAGSDGFLESLSPSEIAAILKNQSLQLAEAAVKKCADRSYRDDITVVLTHNLFDLPKNEILVFGVSDGNGSLGDLVSNYIAKNLKTELLKVV